MHKLKREAGWFGNSQAHRKQKGGKQRSREGGREPAFPVVTGIGVEPPKHRPLFHLINCLTITHTGMAARQIPTVNSGLVRWHHGNPKPSRS